MNYLQMKIRIRESVWDFKLNFLICIEYQELKRMSLPAWQVELVLERTRKETVMMLLQLQNKRTGQILNLGNLHAFWMNHIAMDVVTLQVCKIN